MAAASLGMAAGFGFASFLLRRRIELGWVPVAGVAMTAFSFLLALIPTGDAGDFLRLLETDPLSFAIAAPCNALFLLALGLLAFVSALFLAPLNAWMQDRYPAEKRGELQSAVNLQNCFSGIIAVAVISGFELGAKALGLQEATGFRFQMHFIAAACLLATVLIIRMLPADFIRIIGIAIVRTIYRIRTVHPERVPKKGGVLLLPNHVTYADAFFLSVASPRPLRFVMDEVFIAKRSIRIFTGIFDTMTIRRDQPLEAIREIIRALKNGDAVCLFPEGQLTRTGSLCVLQRGFELIARKAGHPLIPLWCDGTWGSVFSYEGNRFFRKIPRPIKHGITLACGNPIPPGEATLDSVRDGMWAASSEAMARIFSSRGWSSRMPRLKTPASTAFRKLDEATRQRMWANGYQIGAVNALHRRHPVHVLKNDPVLTELPGLLAAFSDLFDAELKIHELFDGEQSGSWVGGDFLRHAIQTSQITASDIRFYDFSNKALKPVERAGLCHCPGLAVNGTVICLSMPHPAESSDNFEPQHGHKLHAWGKLLPGWRVVRRPSDGTLHVHGPAAPAAGLPLPPKSAFDDEGFLVQG
jgi:acyl-[acyl-carrier-protein]-phospholipid O-acyltransferase / long-chain-fatty-acid--[acyl-carrier-protein] ligase